MAQKQYTVTAPSGKTYTIPWNKPTEITEKDIDDYIAAQENVDPFTKGIQEVAEVKGKAITPKTMFESFLPESVNFAKPYYDPSRERVPSFPERAIREIGTDIVRGAASPAGVITGLIGGGGALFPNVRRGVGNIFRSVRGAAVPDVPPVVSPVVKPPINVGELPKPQLPPEFQAVDEVLPTAPTRLENVIPPSPMEEAIKLQSTGRPFKDMKDVDLDLLVKRNIKGAIQEKALRAKAPKSANELINAEVLKTAINEKPKLRAGANIQEVELVNPNELNVKNAIDAGFKVKSQNPDGSLTLIKPVKDVTAPPSLKAPQFGQKKSIQEVGDITKAKLPKELAGAKPTYHFGNTAYNPVFESDLDKAAYIIGRADKRSARDADYLKFVMDHTGLDENAARAYGAKVRGAVKSAVKTPGQGAGTVKIPHVGFEPPSGVQSVADVTAPPPPIKPPIVDELAEAAPAPKGPPIKPTEEPPLIKVGGTLKSLASGADLSAPLRQARPLMDRPEYWKALPDMFKSALSEEGYQKLNQSIIDRPNFKPRVIGEKTVKSRAQEAGLQLTDLGEDFTTREEALMSNLPEKLASFAPDKKLAAPIRGIGRLYRGSNRAYTGFLNKLRADVFDSMIADAEKLGNITPEVEKQIANFVNNATGRGSLRVPGLGSFEESGKLLNAVFFSPRLLSSRVKILTSPVSYYNAPKVVRDQAIRSWLTLAGSQSAIAGLSYLAGNDTAIDPRSSDFGKLKIGNTRIDLGGGFNQLITLGARLSSGKLVSSNTNKVYDLQNPKFGGPTEIGVFGQFLRSKESPLAGLATELYTGKDFIGQPLDRREAIAKRVLPMFLTDLMEIAQEEKPEMIPYVIALGAPLGLFGAGLQTYGPKVPKRKPGSMPRR